MPFKHFLFQCLLLVSCNKFVHLRMNLRDLISDKKTMLVSSETRILLLEHPDISINSELSLLTASRFSKVFSWVFSTESKLIFSRVHCTFCTLK